MPFSKNTQNYTYADYLSWPKDVRAEIIEGNLYMKAAPFHVVLNLDDENKREEDNRNVVEPDISIICDHSLLDGAGCKGTPDLIIEIISPSTGRKDKLEKFNKYEQGWAQRILDC